MRNPKKQAVDTKLKAMACYLIKSEDPMTNQQRKGPWGTIGIGNVRLGLGFCEAVRRPRRRGGAVDGG